jgi:hypothetical protein
MALPTAYLTSTKNLKGIMEGITTAQAPKQFTQKFLENLGFKSNTDRLVINVLKAIGFLDATGAPTERYFRYLDQTQSAKVLAEGIREAYGDLFAVNINAQNMTRPDVKNKLRTLTQGQSSDAVLDKMAMTFRALSDLAEWTGSPTPQPAVEASANGDEPEKTPETQATLGGVAAQHGDGQPRAPVRLGGLVYNIELVLPESRDPAVYDALFRSLRTHLLA